MFDIMFLFQIEGFDVKRVDEYHLTGIALDMFVRWERRPPSSTDNRNDARGEGRPKPEQKKPEDAHYSEGLVRSYRQTTIDFDTDFKFYFSGGQC